MFTTSILPLGLLVSLVAQSRLAYAVQASPEQLASQYSLTTSTSFPFPTETLASTDTDALLVSQWGLSKGRIQDGPGDVAFVDDPYPDSPAPYSTTNSTGPVLEVTYAEGSYSHDTGGTQLYSLWNYTDSPFQSMMFTYDIAFDADFDFVKGGKLPGIRGGPNPLGCSGGNQPNGTDCFSTRVMWRKNGAGEGVFSN